MSLESFDELLEKLDSMRTRGIKIDDSVLRELATQNECGLKEGDCLHYLHCVMNVTSKKEHFSLDYVELVSEKV